MNADVNIMAVMLAMGIVGGLLKYLMFLFTLEAIKQEQQFI